MDNIKTDMNPVMEIMNGMVSQIHWEDIIKRQNKDIFRRRFITIEEGDTMHTAIRAALEKELDGLKSKAELFALLYVCQPEALFRRRRLTRVVRDYAARHLGLRVAAVSAQKKNLAFLYFNDKVFRAIAVRAVEAATQDAEKENTPVND